MKRTFHAGLALSLLASILAFIPMEAVNAVSTNPTPNCSAGSTCTITFTYTGDYYTWTVPSGNTSLTVDLQGAQGGLTRSSSLGGNGGRVQATLAVTASQTLYIYVGGQGTAATTSSNASSGGWNGGGKGGIGYSSWSGSGGGGASDIRTTAGNLSSRLIVAGGGGGAACNSCSTTVDDGGVGGGLVGGSSVNSASGSTQSTGGTQSAGGAGNTWSSWAPSTGGSLGVGGDGHLDGATSPGAGGGGGGGYYGGGGGSWVGGGGGSSYANATYATGVTHTQGTKTGHGTISITYLNSPTVTTFSTSQSSPTNIGTGSTVSFSLVLSQSVSDLAVSDFQFGGTSTCNTPGLSGSGATYTVTVTNCSAGTLILQLKANSVTGTSSGPTAVASANTIVIDRVLPTISALQSYPTGIYYPGNALTFNLVMSETVTVSGTPRIPLTVGSVTRYATYSAGTNTKLLSFTYTVASDIAEIDGDNVEMLSPIEANGGSITDLATNVMSAFTYTPATLSLTIAQPPSAPIITSITPANAQLSVAFTAGAANGALTTKYQYSTDNGVNWKDRAAGTTASPLVITTVSSSASAIVNATAYNIRIRGVSAAGNGDSSTVVSATPSAVVISGDSTLTSTHGQTASTGTYSSSGGTGPYTYTLSSTPTGVSISGGVVTASSSTPAGTYTQNVLSTDNASQVGTKQLVITVNKASTSITITLPNSATNAALGGAVTITATVPRAGVVNFMLGGTTISGCGSASAASTTATCSWTPGALGSVSLTATFTPTDSTNYETSTTTSLSITVVNGVSTVTLSLTGGTTTPPKGQAINIIAAVDQAGKVSFYADGKRIPGCFNLSASAGSKSCSWKPAVQKQVNLTATLNPTNNVYNNSTASLAVWVIRRSGTR